MSAWWRVVWRGAIRALQAWLYGVVEGISATDVAEAKEQAAAAVQAQRRVPGAVRRWLCDDIRRIDAATVDEWKRKARAEIARL